MLRLPSPFSLPSVSLGLNTIPISPFSLRIVRVAIFTLYARIVLVRSIRIGPIFRLEALGSPVFPYYPILFFDMFFDPGRIAPARPLRWFDIALICLTIKASTFSAFEAQ